MIKLKYLIAFELKKQIHLLLQITEGVSFQIS